MKKPAVLFLLFAAACGHGTATVRLAATAAEKECVRALELMTAYDLQHQRELEHAAEPAKSIASYRAKRDVVLKSIAGANALARILDPLLAAIDHGISHESDLDAWISDLLGLVKAVEEGLVQMGILTQGQLP